MTATGSARPAGSGPSTDESPTPHYSRGLFWRLGEWCARRRWIVLGTWLVIVVATTLGSSALNGAFKQTFNLPNSSAQIGADLLQAHTDQSGAAAPGTASGSVVFHVSTGNLAADRAAIEASIAEIRALSTVKEVADPFTVLSPDGRVAIASIAYKDAVQTLSPSDVVAVDNAMTGTRSAGVSVDYGGDLGTTASSPSSNTSSELIGIGVALIILLFAFGSVIATVLPVISAVVGIFSGLGVLGILSAYIAFPSESPTIALMMGLGVGIDYALFLSTRFRQLIADGNDPTTAAASTVASSGRAVIIAAATVIVSLVGLYASGVAYVGQLGVSAGITVAVGALAAVTAVPALLAIAGTRIDRVRVRKPVAEPSGDAVGWHRYAAALGKHPVLYLASALAVLGILALPALSIQIGNPGVRAFSVQSTERQASNAIDSGFGAGYQATLTVVVEAPPHPTPAQLAQVANDLHGRLANVSGVASVSPFMPTADNALLVGKVIPTTGVYDPATQSLITRLDTTDLPGILHAAGYSGYSGYVTGSVASSLALQEAVARSLPVIIFTVAGAAVLLMLVTFRSPVLALKAGIINLLSIGASYGVLVAVFQWGWGSSLLGLPQPVPIVSFVPMLMFAIVFGLSMDYEVFLLSRVRESWMKVKDNRLSVTHGLSVTGRIITSAAVIMACVFFSFLLSPSVTIKMLAFGLGVSVIIDVTIVRLVVVPCAMLLFDRANWWTPRWLDRVLPHLEP